MWDALEDTPTEAENVKLGSRLMIAITEAVAAWNVTQAGAARRLGVIQPRLDDLLRGRVGKFSLNALVALAACASLVVHLEIKIGRLASGLENAGMRCGFPPYACYSSFRRWVVGSDLAPIPKIGPEISEPMRATSAKSDGFRGAQPILPATCY